MKRMSRSWNAEAAVKPERKHESHIKAKLVAGERPSHVRKSRSSVELHLQPTKLSDYHCVTKGWTDSISTTPPCAPIPHTKMSDSGVDLSSIEETGSQSESQTPRSSPPLLTPQRSNSPARTLPVRTRKSSFSSSSTLFERSSAVPITIIVTTADDESITENEDSPASSLSGPSLRRSRRGSTTSLPAHFMPDRSRLMPPLDPQVDMRRLRKAREFEDIRNFLIGFLNTKGTQLPKTLRVRIMSVYGITDGHLSPDVVSKFTTCGDGPDMDEAAMLKLAIQGPEPTNREHMRILQMAFQSILPSAAPMGSHDILAARRKRMSMPLSSATGSKSMSLHSVDEHSALSAKMSLERNFRSKQTLDSIISNRALLQSTRKPPNIAASISAASTTSGPSPVNSFFSRRRSSSIKSVGKTQSLANVPLQSSSASISSTTSRKRPQSLYRYITDPMPNVRKPPTSTILPPTFKQPDQKLSRSKTGSLSSSTHRPPISSRLIEPPLSNSQPKVAQQLELAELSLPPIPPPKSPLRAASVRSLSMTPPSNANLTRSGSVVAYSRAAERQSANTGKPRTISPPVQAHSKAPKHVPGPIAVNRPQNEPVILAPTPISPAHRLTHKALTRSEASEIEKPFQLHRRRSSSTLSTTSPVFSTPSQSSSPSGYESDGSVIVFPVHPGFAPLGRENCNASIKVDERRHYEAATKEKQNHDATMKVSEKATSGNKLKKEKKEKRTSLLGALKRSLFGRS